MGVAAIRLQSSRRSVAVCAALVGQFKVMVMASLSAPGGYDASDMIL
jgi:hypothetical protein